MPDVVPPSDYLLDRMVGEQKLVASVAERLVGPSIGPEGGAFAPSEGADLSPGHALELAP